MLGSRIALLSVHRATHSPARRINETVHDKRAITADTVMAQVELQCGPHRR